MNLQIPWELAGKQQVYLAATLNGQTGSPQRVTLAAFAPAIFTVNAQGAGQGAILDTTNRLVDATNPAVPGDTVVQTFCTGLGTVSNPPLTGEPASLTQLSYTNVTPQVNIGGIAADVLFSGLAPGFVGLPGERARAVRRSDRGCCAGSDLDRRRVFESSHNRGAVSLCVPNRRACFEDADGRPRRMLG